METFIGKKRNIDHKTIADNNKQNETKTKNESEQKDDEKNNNDMKNVIDDCFDDFINGNTSKLFENYNLLKQKFYEIIQN